MRYLTDLWHHIRHQPTPDPTAALLRTRNTLLAGENATLSEITALLRRELRSTQAQLNASQAQLLASRAEHDNALRRLAAVESDYAEVCDELRRVRRRERRQRRAMRGWITRSVKARVAYN
jgi:predicted  nucleic acid-binding Zn-ribbon protein